MADQQIVFGNEEIHTGSSGVLLGGKVKRLKEVSTAIRSVSSEPLEWEKWSTLYPFPGNICLHPNRKVDHIDLENAAVKLGVKPAAIWAIGEKETKNVGFSGTGLPLIRINQKYFDDRISTWRDIVGTARAIPEVIEFDQEWLKFCLLIHKNSTLAIAATGFGRWQVLGYNFSHRTVYVDPDQLRPCPPTYKDAQNDSNFEEYKGLGFEFLGDIGESLFHGGADLVTEVGTTGGFQQECAYNKDGKLANEQFEATPNQHSDTILHTIDDDGGPFRGLSGIPTKRALTRFFIDMHVDERIQLAYFVFVVQRRKPLHEALIAASENPHNLALWEKVAELYNGPKHAERDYGPDLQKFFFEYDPNR